MLFVAAFYPDNSVFCEKMRMSLGTMKLIWNKSASVFLKHVKQFFATNMIYNTRRPL